MNTSSKPNDEFSKLAAVTLLPNLQQIFNHALYEVVTKGITSESKIEEIIGKYSSFWPVPDDVSMTLAETVMNFKKILQNSNSSTYYFKNIVENIQQYKTNYLVFHQGRTHYYNTVPDDILAVKKSILFWADFSKDEFYTIGESFSKNQWLEPVAEQMLRFVCKAGNSGKIINFGRLYSNICRDNSCRDIEKLRNWISVRQNQINSLGRQRLFRTVSDCSAANEEKVLRLRGEDKYKIGKNIMDQVCIIKKAPVI
jgi:hypothetical protein